MTTGTPGTGSRAPVAAGAGSRSSVTVNRIGYIAEAGDDAAAKTAAALAGALGATVAEAGDAPVDLLVLGSREGTPEGRLELSAAAEYAIETATSPVVAVPRAKAIEFAAAPVSA